MSEQERQAFIEQALAAGRRSLEDIRMGRLVPAQEVQDWLRAKVEEMVPGRAA